MGSRLRLLVQLHFHDLDPMSWGELRCKCFRATEDDPWPPDGMQNARDTAAVTEWFGSRAQKGHPQSCEPAVLGENGSVTISLAALYARSAPGTVDALGPVVTAGPFGVGKSMAVLLAVFAFLLGAMVLGGHLGAASRRRKHRQREHRPD